VKPGALFRYRIGVGALLIVAGGFVACSRQPQPAASLWLVDAVNGEAILEDVKAFVALGPRVAGTDGARGAALYLKTRLERAGITAEIDEFDDVAPSGANCFRNVIVRVPGGPDLILLLAHYDTKDGVGERFVGANDSGSGVGVLLALAGILHGRPSARGAAERTAGGVRPTVWLAFLDGEECRVSYGPTDGLHGSRRLARQVVAAGRKESVRAVILLDMIGDRDLTVTIPRNGTPELMKLAFEAAAAEGVRARFSLFPGGILDDHQPFLDAGMPAVDLIDFEYGSAPKLNDYWHTEGDTVDKLSAGSLGRIGRVTVRMLNALMRDAGGGE
jgi:glutaminyl-peptide cyclotransferase